MYRRIREVVQLFVEDAWMLGLLVTCALVARSPVNWIARKSVTTDPQRPSFDVWTGRPALNRAVAGYLVTMVMQCSWRNTGDVNDIATAWQRRRFADDRRRSFDRGNLTPRSGDRGRPELATNPAICMSSLRACRSSVARGRACYFYIDVGLWSLVTPEWTSQAHLRYADHTECRGLASPAKHGRPHIGAKGVSWPPGKIDEKMKSENMQKRAVSMFMLLFWEQSRQAGVETALCWPNIYSHILQNAPFRSQIFKIFFASGGKGALTAPFALLS